MLQRISAINSAQKLSKVQKRKFSSKKLDSGVTIINTNTSPSNVTGNVSLFVKAGSRYETKLTKGSTHFLKHLAFRDNVDHFGLTLVRAVECLGGELLCTIDRDVIGYHVYGTNEKMNKLAPILKTIVAPKVWEWQVDEVRNLVHNELRLVDNDVPNVIMESLYQNSFRNSGLSQGVYATEFDSDRLVPQHIMQHVNQHFYPGVNAVVIANGLTSEYEGKEYENYENLAGVPYELEAFEPLPELAPTPQNTTFVGGESFVRGGKNVHVGIAFPGGSVIDQNQGALLVLKELLGCATECGGRLFELREKNEWILQANAFNSSFTDAGIFGLYAEASGYNGRAAELSNLLIAELKSLVEATNEEFEIAKKVALGRAIRASESPLNNNTLTALAYFSNGTTQINRASEISKVTKKDVTELIQKLLSSKASYVTAGDITGTPSLSSLLSQ